MTVRHLLVSLSVVLIAVSAAAQDRMGDDAIVGRLSDDFRYRDVSGNFVDGPVAYGELIGG